MTGVTEPYTLSSVLPAAKPPRPGWIVPVVVVLVVLVLALAGLAAWALTRQSGTAAAAGTPSPATTSSSAATATTRATPAAPTIHAPGETVVSTDGLAKSTVFAYQQPVATNAPTPAAPGTEWAAADVQVCASGDKAISVSEYPWAIGYANGGVIRPSNIKYNQFPQPAYPYADRGVEPGGCVRGWIVFPALQGQRPSTVEYAPDGRLPVKWTA